MQRYVPEKITSGIKQGFSAPDASWFKGESIDYVRKLLFNNRAHVYDWFDRGAIQELVTEHLDGKRNRRLLIWSLLNFEWWLTKYIF
jgi:asparagine synthase (glutamine-hydrolysing)